MLILCIKIFLVRIIDVSLGTFRTVSIVKGKTMLSTIIGFIEVLIWFLMVKEALSTDETSIFIAFSYAGGFATGTYIGGLLSKRLIKGSLNVQVITNKPGLVNFLREEGFPVSEMDVRGKDSSVGKSMLIIGISNSKYNILMEKIYNYDSMAFIYVNEIKYAQNGFIK